jgi:hypothetical protein
MAERLLYSECNLLMTVVELHRQYYYVEEPVSRGGACNNHHATNGSRLLAAGAHLQRTQKKCYPRHWVRNRVRPAALVVTSRDTHWLDLGDLPVLGCCQPSPTTRRCVYALSGRCSDSCSGWADAVRRDFSRLHPGRTGGSFEYAHVLSHMSDMGGEGISAL